MKILFFGTSAFSVPSLVKLNECHELLLVVTKPDKPKGRHLLSLPSPIKSKAQELNIPLFFIEKSPPERIINELRKYQAELFVVIAYGNILPSNIFSVPRFYSIGLHASLLPKYRGAAPINWAILNGDRQTGVTVFRLNEKMDAGDIILQKADVILDSDNAEALSLRLSEIGANLLLEAIALIEEGKGEFVKQVEDEATYAPKLKKEDGIIDWTKGAIQIHNQVRAMYNWPGAFSDLGGRAIKFWQTDVIDLQLEGHHKPGEVIKVKPNGLFVSCGKGTLWIKELQLEGGRRMSVSDYLLGHKISVGVRFRSKASAVCPPKPLSARRRRGFFFK